MLIASADEAGVIAKVLITNPIAWNSALRPLPFRDPPMPPGCVPDAGRGLRDRGRYGAARHDLPGRADSAEGGNVSAESRAALPSCRVASVVPLPSTILQGLALLM